MTATSRRTAKNNRLRLTKQQHCTCITLFSTFLCRHCTTTTWKCLISRSVEDVNTTERLSFSFPKLRYSLLEFSSRNNCQHLTNWMRWNKRDYVWSSATSLFNWRSRSRRRIQRSLLNEVVGEGSFICPVLSQPKQSHTVIRHNTCLFLVRNHGTWWPCWWPIR